MKKQACLIPALILTGILAPRLTAQIAITTNYTQDFGALGTALPGGWGVWTSSTTTGNGNAFTWNITPTANDASATATNYFRNLPGAGQTWSASLSAGSDRALGWRAGNAASRDGSITFSLTDSTGYNFDSLSFKVFTPNSAGTAATFQFQYQIGALTGRLRISAPPFLTRPSAPPVRPPLPSLPSHSPHRTSQCSTTDRAKSLSVGTIQGRAERPGTPSRSTTLPTPPALSPSPPPTPPSSAGSLSAVRFGTGGVSAAD